MNSQAHETGQDALAAPAQHSGPFGSPQTRLVRVLLVDDAPDILRLLRTMLDFHDGILVCGQATNGLQAVALWQTHQPDVVVMDLRMPLMSGLEVAAQILDQDPAQCIVLFSAAFTVADHAQADALGIVRCFDKRDLERLPDLVHNLGPRRRSGA
jgi:CheY-like chemotaxis protein